MRLRMGGLLLSLMTLFMVMRVSFTHHLRIGPAIFLGVAWTLFAISYARRNRRAAWRARGALEDAYALGGLENALVPARVRVGSSLPITPSVVAAEPEEADDHEDALADFDRRLAALQKGN